MNNSLNVNHSNARHELYYQQRDSSEQYQQKKKLEYFDINDNDMDIMHMQRAARYSSLLNKSGPGSGSGPGPGPGSSKGSHSSHSSYTGTAPLPGPEQPSTTRHNTSHRHNTRNDTRHDNTSHVTLDQKGSKNLSIPKDFHEIPKILKNEIKTSMKKSKCVLFSFLIIFLTAVPIFSYFDNQQGIQKSDPSSYVKTSNVDQNNLMPGMYECMRVSLSSYFTVAISLSYQQ